MSLKNLSGSPRASGTVALLLKAFACGLLVSRLIPAAVANDKIELDPLIAEAEQQRIEAVARAMPSAVSVFVPGGAGGGSGVLISPDGFALTNFHVSSPAGTHMRCGLSDGNIYDAVIVGIDPVGDLALIRLLGRNDFPFAKMADSRLAEVGDWCMAIGNPFLLATNLQPTVTYGILSGVGRYQYPSGTLLEYGDCLQTDASINPGNSGGPLYDARGDLLGVIGRASFEKRGRVNVGVGYAISIHQAKNFLGYLHSGRIVDHATLGATVVTDEDEGVIVSNILEASDAYRRGLRYGAEILELDGRPVSTANELKNILATLPQGWRVKLTYRYEGETVDTLVRLAGVHRRDELLEKMASALPPPPPRRAPGDRPQSPDGGEDQSPESEDGGEADPPAEKTKAKKQRDVPEAVSKQYQARKGFANYHFNLVHQEQFIDRLRDQFPSAAVSDAVDDPQQERTWVIEGVSEADGNPDVTMRLGPDELSLAVGDVTFEAQNKADLYEAVEAGSVGAILPALDGWRRMLQLGPRRYGETIYQGTVPLAGERPLRDCVTALDGAMELRWLQHPESGLVEVIEVAADPSLDPAELWISRDDLAPGGQPSHLELRYGLEPVFRMEVKSWSVEGTEKSDEASGEG